MSPAEIVNTAEFHVYERALYKVDAVVPQQAESRRHQAACCTPPRWLLDRCARPFTASLAATMQMPERRPQPSGVLDPRLGVSNKRSTCETCGQVRGRMIRKMIRVGDSGKEVRQAWGVLLRRPAAPCKEAHLAHFRPSSPASLPPPPAPPHRARRRWPTARVTLATSSWSCRCSTSDTSSRRCKCCSASAKAAPASCWARRNAAASSSARSWAELGPAGVVVAWGVGCAVWAWHRC